MEVQGPGEMGRCGRYGDLPLANLLREVLESDAGGGSLGRLGGAHHRVGASSGRTGSDEDLQGNPGVAGHRGHGGGVGVRSCGIQRAHGFEAKGYLWVDLAAAPANLAACRC